MYLMTRNNPFNELRREMDRLWDDFGGPSGLAGTAASHWNPACDIEEGKDHFLLTVDMPGVPKDQIKIEVVDDQLTVSGERKREERRQEDGAWYTERRYGQFSRTFSLPSGVDPARVEAQYQDGVLKILVPKAETAKPRQIKVDDAGNSGFFGKLLGKKETKETESTAA